MPQCSLGAGPAPNYFELEAVATARVNAGNHGPLPQCLPGATLRPDACWGCYRAALFTLQQSVRGRSPGQPAACGSAGALLLFTHSLLRPRGHHSDFSLHAPQYNADTLGPGPSPELRPAGPAVEHAGIWSLPRPPYSKRVYQEGSDSPHNRPRSSHWRAAPSSGRNGHLHRSYRAGGGCVCSSVCFKYRPASSASSLSWTCVLAEWKLLGGGAVRAKSSNGVEVEGFTLRKLQNPGARALSLSQLEGQGQATARSFPA